MLRFSARQLSSLTRLIDHQNVRAYSNRYIRIPTLDVCRVCISPIHKLPHVATAILSDPTHVLYPSLGRRYEPLINRQHDEFKEGLWMIYTSNPMQRKKVVRSWARRRLAQAVTEALRIRGFDGNGRSTGIRDSTDVRVKNKARGPDVLIGTVDVEILNVSVETKFAEVQRQTGLVADEIVKICGRRAGEVRRINSRVRRISAG